MLFNTLAYAQFFAVVFVASWLLARARQLRVLFLLLASYFFYAQWDVRFLSLIFASSSIDWWLGNRIGYAKNPGSKRKWLIATVVLNLGVLGVFKYFNFGIDSARALLESLGFHPPEMALRIALPVGISFFTFESMSYVIDVYRGELPPHPSYIEYLCFVAFFPHLVAGPIVRPRDLLPQLAHPARFSAEHGSEGLFLIAIGLIKKVAIGDYLALNLIDRVFDAPLRYSSVECYAAVVAYAVQIYCDFSGYTDIAIGSALLLGVRFPLNFNSPYKAASIQEFWRRWHISLSTWLRDYLYVPLGGNRQGRLRTYSNLLITMLLGGLWHGANWTFVVWGALHGVALAANRAWGELVRGKATGSLAERPAAPHRLRLGVVLRVVLVFHFVCVAWIFFRSESFDKAHLMFQRLAELSTHHQNLPWTLLSVLGVGLGSHFVPERLFQACQRGFIRCPGVVQGLLLFAVALLLRRFASSESVPFVYFQF